MPEIPRPNQFQPDSHTLRTWLNTRKDSYFAGTRVLPGLFRTEGFGKDTAFVTFAIAVEAAALGMTMYGGFSAGGADMIAGASIAVFLFVALDVLGVWLHHSRVAKDVRLKNQILTHPSGSADYNRQLNAISGKRVLAFFLFLFSMILKIGAILLLIELPVPVILLLMIFYILVVYVHLNHTGYWYYKYLTSKRMNREFDEWAKDMSERNMDPEKEVRHEAKIIKSNFTSIIEVKLTNDIKEYNGHRLRYIGKTDDKYEYELSTLGVLIDRDIVGLCNGFLDEQQLVFSLFFLKHQMQNFGV